jgi:WD40 repeat protein
MCPTYVPLTLEVSECRFNHLTCARAHTNTLTRTHTHAHIFQRLLAIPAYDPSQISLFDLRERKRTALLTLPAADAPVGMCMSIRAVPGGTDPLGANVVAGYEDGSVIGWDLRNRAMLWRSKLFDEPAVAVAVGLSKSGGCRVVAGGAGDTLHIGKLPTRAADSGAGEGNPVSQLRDLKTIQLKHAGINSISIRDDGKLFATAGWDNRVRLFSWPKCSPLAILGYHRAAVNVVSWSNAVYEVDGGKLLAAGSKDTCISLWSVYQP